ncbi:RimJ/RimL family protein N-acetyltransferase/methionyl-tRNA formyltransferase [Paucibacter oligotrophus]|uniref:RimJ/RimL family protein N-acetyltransferase/methionyl-tRNA formyltransferase n=1 Tax=Roseateles oligotrophus TaxID=1769250 RepID=A0A840LAL9_9BURK|nr:GNAT family N-acetyltransferase [Roseateles oligotrophus]MBB4842417.1 RimJ/RimL family protein N-acetyltransferase/methionyl-tRNA formyltransferase [Roseateles oligotrophus]
MLINQRLRVDGLELRCLHEDEVGEAYLGWLNDPLVNQYLEVRHAPPGSVAELRQFVRDVNVSPDNLLLGMFTQNGQHHIGNIKLGPINRLHRRAEIGIVCGDRAEWGKGYATTAIRLLSDFAEQHLDLQRLSAGCYAGNGGSLRAFQKAGFTLEATLPDYWQLGDGGSVSQHLLGRVRIREESSTWTASAIDTLVFIGGGLLMTRCMERARALGFRTGALLAERHANETLAGGQTLATMLSANEQPHRVLTSVDQVDPAALFAEPGRALALCFGPAWIFPETIIERFAVGMFNFNGIPIPRYLGGAHYTWQILNDYRHSGCHIQQITPDVDRGNLLMSASFELPAMAATPEAYFEANDACGYKFLDNFLGTLARRETLQLRRFEAINADRLYFPRLMTRDNGWIDWSWSGADILRFCNAFAAPYPGASTHYRGRRLFVKKASLLTDAEHAGFHPFCAGLIVRMQTDSFTVVVRDGLLRIEAWAFEGDSPALKEGERLDTDAAQLARARLYRPKI